jgi:hypothetical protein
MPRYVRVVEKSAIPVSPLELVGSNSLFPRKGSIECGIFHTDCVNWFIEAWNTGLLLE